VRGIKLPLRYCRLRFSDDFDDPVRQLKLLWSTGSEECIDTLSDVTWIFFSLQEQEDIWLNAQSLCHRYNGIETRYFLPPFYITPEVAGYVATFCGLLKTEFRSFSQPSDALSK
jgi:hypothetical protein